MAHSGKLGGARKRVGKTAFLASYPGELEDVVWPDGRTTSVVVLGRINNPHLPNQIAHFVKFVEQLKKSVTPPGSGRVTTGSTSFVPEFSGVRSPYGVSGEIEARCDHGIVVDALAKQMRLRGLDCGNDQHRDLYLATSSGRAKLLFEIKTECTTTNVYSAVGQLMLHGALDRPAPKRVLVVPCRPRQRTQQALRKLGVNVLIYRWREGRPVFDGLDRLL